jgi:hypothetical protein
MFKYLTLGFKIDEIKNLEGFNQPDYIKIDVDGIEHMILEGGISTLKKVSSVLIEINDDFTVQKNNCEKILKNAGLSFVNKTRTSPLDSKTPNIFNQIWIR